MKAVLDEARPFVALGMWGQLNHIPQFAHHLKIEGMLLNGLSKIFLGKLVADCELLADGKQVELSTKNKLAPAVYV